MSSNNEGQSDTPKIPGISHHHFNIIKVALENNAENDADIQNLCSIATKPTPGKSSVQVIDSYLRESGREQQANRIELANIVAHAVQGNVDIASEILRDSKVQNARDIALHYGLNQMKVLASSSSSSSSSTPSISAQDEASKNESSLFATKFRRRMFALEPTAVLQQMMASEDPADRLQLHSSASIQKAAVDLLNRNPEFNIRNTSVTGILDANSQSESQSQDENEISTAVADSLKLLQRVQAVAPTPEVISPLIAQGMTSAHIISSKPKNRFIKRMAAHILPLAKDSIEAENLAASVHDHAMETRIRAEHALVQMHQWTKGTGLTPIDGALTTLKDRQAVFKTVAESVTGSSTTVNLDALFGDMNVCECDACLDVTSPTAYYVDLLQYLRNNNLDDDPKYPDPSTKGIQGTVLEKLFQRRPDLQHLQLTCANANTVLPMIDLANEVMEAFTIHAASYANSGTVNIETWNIGIETTGELLASPSHTRKKAYCILKTQVYPVSNLPYFQPLDASRLYLNYLGISRYELINTLRTSGSRQWPVRASLIATPEKLAAYNTLLGQVQDRAAAAEYLGFSPDEYIIVTRESLWPINCSQFADDGLPIDQPTYLKDIGVLDPWLYWGYPNEASLLDDKTGLSFVKTQFLIRSGLSFVETVDLVQTYYVNPMMPTGQDKVLLSNIRFSYRFLQHMTIGITDTTQRNAMISDFIFQQQAWVQKIEQDLIPPTGNPLVKPDIPLATFTAAQISAWVTKWFECLGKLIVLDSGQGPRLPLSGYLIWVPTKNNSQSITLQTVVNESIETTDPQPVLIGWLDSSGELYDSVDQLVGFVGANGKVYYQGLKGIRDAYPTGTIILWPVPKQKPWPTLQQLAGIPLSPGQQPALVDSQSFLQTYIKERPTTVSWMSPSESCSIDKTTIVHLSGSPLQLPEWDRINRFIRLYKKMASGGWTIANVDSALVGLWKVPEIPPPPANPPGTDPNQDTPGFSFSNFADKGCGCDDGSPNPNPGSGISPCDPSNFINIGPGFMKQLMSIQQLEAATGLDLDKLLCLWTNIGTMGNKSLYARLFLTHDIQGINDVFRPDDNGNYLVSEPKIGAHISVLVAALRINTKIFPNVLAVANLTNDSIITIEALTKLYRHTVLANILGVSSTVLLDILKLSPNPYASAAATLQLYNLQMEISNTGFNIKQLLYVILGLDNPLRPIAPSQVSILKTTKSIIDALMAIDTAQPDLTAQEQSMLTAAQVKAKATMLFTADVVTDIMGIIEGTRVYKTNAPIGLIVDPAKISSKIIYKDPSTPPNRRATLSITGCLTDTEKSAAIGLFPNNNDWIAAIGRLQKQAVNLVKSLLGDVISGDLDNALQILTQGDVAATPGTSASDPGTPGTAIAKRVYFMDVFMPYLRLTLYTKSIVATMSAVASVSADICTWLLSTVIKIGQTQKSALQVLIDLKSHVTSNGGSGSWSGFILAPSTDSYVFYGYGDTRPTPLLIGGASIPFTGQSEDPSNLWWTDPVNLIGGQVVSLQVSGQSIPGDLQWKTSRSGLSPVPASALIPDASVGDATTVFAPLLKASLIIMGFSLSYTEISYLQLHGSDFGNLDLNSLTFDAWKRLLCYFNLRQSLPTRSLSLIDLFKWTKSVDNPTATVSVADISAKVSAVTAWDQPTIVILMDKKNFNLVDIKLFQNETALTKLNKTFAFINKIGILNVELLLSWTDLKLDFNPTWTLAKSIRTAIRAKYSETDYEQAIKPSHDTLRKNQRDALISFLLNQQALQKWGVIDADSLFEFFLIDVQMGSCMQTSRIKQAISSAQLFVQRCMLGLEEKYGVANDALDAERWKWMCKQTLWTANRKVVLWAEAWMLSPLRDDKTPIYVGMESNMLQRDINPSSALDSFKSYITELDQIAHLRAVGVYLETIDAKHVVFHCVAMTIGAPYLFFYRNYDFKALEWTPWVRITVDIPTYSISYSTVEPPKFAAANSEGNTEANTTGTAAAGGRKEQDVFTGCYTIPVAYDSRKLLFIGEITTKADPNSTALSEAYGALTTSTTDSAATTSPNQIYELKLSWTEYQSGRWTKKQTVLETFETYSYSPDSLPDIDSFQFMPQLITNSDGTKQINIEIWLYYSQSAYFLGNYIFNGTIVTKGSTMFQDIPTGWTQLSFQLVGGRTSGYFITSSLQKSTDGKSLPYLNQLPYVKYTQDGAGIMNYTATKTDDFFLPFSSQLVSAALSATETTGIQPIENVFAGLPTANSQWADDAFGPGDTEELGADGNMYPTYSELSKPYTNYTWEIGVLGPVQIANSFTTSQQFDDALEMYHKVFNPYADGPDITRVWQWYPFKKAASQNVLETMLRGLKARQANLNISKWRDSPFQPFLVARGRTVVYMKWIVMGYIKTLIAYGDYYFRRRSLEDIPLAIQMYILASHLYGPKMEVIPKKGKKIPQTYFSLQDKWDAFSNAIVQLEVAFPFSNQTPFKFGTIDTEPDKNKSKPQIALANLFGFATDSYFCLPANPALQALRTTIDTRLYNIRNCLDIDGQPMPLALWDAPIDPGELVAAVASGLSLSSALNDMNSNLPNYRFTWLIARALEVTAELKSQESLFLSIKEKRDGEAMQLMRTGQELMMNQMMLDLKNAQLDEAQKTLTSLVNSQQTPVQRFNFFSQLAGADVEPLSSSGQPFQPVAIPIDVPTGGTDTHINQLEFEEQNEAINAQFWNSQASNLEVMAGILNALPSFNIHTTPMGCGIEVAWGMPNIAAAFSAQARQMQILGNSSTFGSVSAQRKSGFIKQFQDRVHQMNLAGLEYEHIKTQIDAQNARIAISKQDITNQQQQIENSKQVQDFLHNKYTNDDLYGYLESTTRASMYQTYLLAYDLAKKAELAFRFERRPTQVQIATKFVSFGYFNAARDGLQANQQLYLSLKQMDQAYQNERGHDYEITKSVSLRLLNPYSLLTLRETGSCTFDVPEVSFDMDFPGHYYRRIKTVTLTIPCIVGPYTGINATLRLLKHKYRADPTAASANAYLEDTSSGMLDSRFRTDNIPIDAVAAASGQSDTGSFELSLKDERYTPFEGAGAVSTWQLTLPAGGGNIAAGFPHQFDYSTISDVILSLRYTSCDGGDLLRKAAASSVVSWIGQVEDGAKDVGLLALVDLRAEFAAEWAKLSGPPSSGSNSGDDIRTLILRGLLGRLPAFVAGRDATKVRTTDVSLVTNLASITQPSSLALNFAYKPPSTTPGGDPGEFIPFDSGPIKVGSNNMFRINEADAAIGDWALNVNLGSGGSSPVINSASRMWLIVRYIMLKQT